MESRFSDLNLQPVERFAAVDGSKTLIPVNWPESSGAYGCLQSHLSVVQQARAQGRESVLIIEDDVLFDERFHEKFRERVRNLPENWDMLFFGCLHHDPPVPVASGIGRLRGSFSTFMYAVRCTVYDAFIRLNTRAKQAVDRNNTILQRLFNCYCFIPHLAWVDGSYSDAQGIHTNHWYIKESMVLRGREVKSMEERTATIISYRAPGNPKRGLRNLKYLTNHYGGLFATLVVECDKRQHIDPATLPASCDYCFLQSEGAADRVRCLLQGLKKYEGRKDYFIFNDGYVVCSRMEIRANLIKCLSYDVVSSFESYIDLSSSDSDLLIDGLECQTEGYLLRPRRSLCSEYFTLTKEAFWTLTDRLISPSPTEKDMDGLRIFDSPGCALCLFSG